MQNISKMQREWFERYQVQREQDRIARANRRANAKVARGIVARENLHR
jgi:hypothetical protein